MAEPQTATVTPKAKPKPVATSASAFEMPKFEMSKMEVPAAFREVAEKGVAQAKEHYEKMKSAAEDATEMLEETYATASKAAPTMASSWSKPPKPTAMPLSTCSANC